MLLILCGRSGSGKTTIERLLVERDGFKSVVSYTTRKPREGEINGVHYNFVSEEEFIKLKKEGALLEDNYLYGTYYGISAEGVEDHSNKLVAVLEYNGVVQVQERMEAKGIEKPVVIYFDATETVVKERIPDRLERIKDDNKMFSLKKYMPVVDVAINADRDIEATYETVKDFLRKHTK